MGVARTQYRDQADQAPLGHLAQHGRREFLADQDGVFRIDQAGLVRLLQIGEQPAAQVPHIGGPFAQIGIVHQLEALDMLHHHLAQGALGPLATLDDGGHLVTEGGVVEHHQVDVEQRLLFLAQLGGQSLGQRLHVRPYAFQRGAEQLQLGVDVAHGLVRDHFQVGWRQDHPLPCRSRPRMVPVASAWAITPDSWALMVTRKASSPSSN